MAALIVLISVSSAVGDGGALRISQERGGRRISVFTSPTPLLPGTIDISVLVQDARGRPRLDTQVRVRAWPTDDPAAVIEAEATTGLATNKLMRAAHLELARPGRWRLAVRVESEELEFDLELGDAPPSWQALAPWVGWPFVVVALWILFRRPRTTDERARL